MTRLGIAALAAAAALLGAPPALAGHTGYRGGCAINAVNDPTPGGHLGGPTQWNGVISIVAQSTDAAGNPTATSISVDCELRINGVSQGIVLSASGSGMAVAVTEFSFTADEDAVVTTCENVLVDGEQHYTCSDIVPMDPVPQPIRDFVGFVLDTVGSGTHPLTCAFLRTYAPAINLVSPANLRVDPSDGDVYLFGTYRAVDCPPAGD